MGAGAIIWCRWLIRYWTKTHVVAKIHSMGHCWRSLPNQHNFKSHFRFGKETTISDNERQVGRGDLRAV